MEQVMPETEPQTQAVAEFYSPQLQPYQFYVPQNVRRLYISAAGGSGGFAHNAGLLPGGGGSGAPGRGGRVCGVISVNPGEMLVLNVGRGANGNQPGIGVSRSGGKGGDRGQGGGGSNGGGGGAASGVWR